MMIVFEIEMSPKVRTDGGVESSAGSKELCKIMWVQERA